VHLRSPAPSPKRMHFRLSAAAIPRRLSRSPVWNRESPIFQQAAARRWSFWRVENCRASKSWRINKSMRKPVIAGNWKMLKTRGETSAFFQGLISQIQDVKHCDIVVAPPFTALSTAVDMAEGTRIEISAQDVHWEEQGAFTGAVSVKMLLDVGCTYTIIGHSERRQYFSETDETVEKKTRAAVAGGLKSIVCVGETLSERDSGQAVEVVRRQVGNGL